MRNNMLSLLLTASIIAFAFGSLYSVDKVEIDCEGKDDLVSLYLLMPFEEFVSVPHKKRCTRAYGVALDSRPELSKIDWQNREPVDLAMQFRDLISNQADKHYHRSLHAVLRRSMMQHEVTADVMDKVFKKLDERIRIRVKKSYEKSKVVLQEVQEQKEYRASRKMALRMRKKEERLKGRGLSLLSYLTIDPSIGTPQTIYEEALKYRCMYLSSCSFLANLRRLWKALGYQNEQVYDQNHDERNRVFAGWHSTASTCETSLQKYPYQGDVDRNVHDSSLSAHQEESHSSATTDLNTMLDGPEWEQLLQVYHDPDSIFNDHTVSNAAPPVIIPKGLSGESIQSLLMALPFKTLICAQSQTPKGLYMTTVKARPEWSNIDWNAESMALAENLRIFISDEADTTYHKALKRVLVLMMTLHGLNAEKRKNVIVILTYWLRHKNKKDFDDKKHLRLESDEQKARRRFVNNRVCKQRMEARKKGLCFPLITYIKEDIENPASLSPEELHRQASRYRGKYSSNKIFFAQLAILWKDLGMNDALLYVLNQNRRYSESGTGSKSTTTEPKEMQGGQRHSKNDSGISTALDHTDAEDDVFADLLVDSLPSWIDLDESRLKIAEIAFP